MIDSVKNDQSDIDQSLELLRSPGLFDKLIETNRELGIVGEENNQKILFMALASRILENPIGLIVKGASSAGKSNLVDSITRFFPSDEIKSVSRLTAKALYHISDDLSHKALIISERHGAEESDYSIRTLQSEKRLVVSTPLYDKKIKDWVTKEKEVMGPIAYVETTTQSHLHPENETRCFEIFIDESEKQTRRIISAQKEQYMGTEIDKASILKPWITAQGLLKSYRVIIPYIEHIRFPTQPLRVRRDFPKFLTLIEISAIMCQFQRQTIIKDGVECLIANIEDYKVAFGLVSVILRQIINSVSPETEKLVNAVKEVTMLRDVKKVNRKEIIEQVNRSRNTVINHLEDAVNCGFLEEDKSDKAFTYKLIRLPNEFDNILLSPDELKDILANENLSNLSNVP